MKDEAWKIKDKRSKKKENSNTKLQSTMKTNKNLLYNFAKLTPSNKLPT